MTTYVSIGNSDDKLSQARWAGLVSDVFALIQNTVGEVHGQWLSPADAPWQNACICFDPDDDQAEEIKAELSYLAWSYDQDSIAWATADTEFLKPDAPKDTDLHP